MKKTYIAVGVVVTLLISGYILRSVNSKNANMSMKNGNRESTASYTLAQVATHKTANDCWMIINNYVYDVSSYISLHPNPSQTIMSGCGTDATARYSAERKHYGREALLATFKIGVLKS